MMTSPSAHANSAGCKQARQSPTSHCINDHTGKETQMSDAHTEHLTLVMHAVLQCMSFTTIAWGAGCPADHVCLVNS